MSSPAEVRPRVAEGPGPETDTVLDGRYLLRHVVGDGGFSTVYAAYDRKILSPVAIKLLKSWCGDSEHRRFSVEILICGRMNHPHIVRVMDGGTHRGRPYSVMPLLPGKPLRSRRGEHWRRIVRLMRQYLEGLRALHDASAFVDPEHRTRVLHRDIKPANCIVSDADHVTILDLGLAKPIDMPMRATTAGILIGSTAYMAPECLLLREPATERSDVYALGVSFYEMLTGELPYTGDVAELRAQLVDRRAARSVRELRPEVPLALAELVQSAMAPVPRDRPLSVAAMLASLDAILVRCNAWEPRMGAPPPPRDPPSPTHHAPAEPAPALATTSARPHAADPLATSTPTHAHPPPHSSLSPEPAPPHATPRHARRELVGAVLLGLAAVLIVAIASRATPRLAPTPTPGTTAAPTNLAAALPVARPTAPPSKAQLRDAVLSRAGALRACPGAPTRLALALDVGARVELAELQYAPADPGDPLAACVRPIVEALPVTGPGPVTRHAFTVDLLSR